MDSNKFSAQVERLGVVETGRRRRWTDDEKLKIVLESMQSPRAVSSTARRYGISRSLLLNWRRSFRTEPDGEAGQKSGFVPAMVVADPVALTPAAPANGRMVIEIGNDRRVIVDAGVDAGALARVLAILERR
ncbi:MAG: IS66 family insertion sequence element accessory protein TnpB [Alphaproteobacteria bacterium]|nr:MAG: IS66 family insertion sequence element accessory protein TnpB [Alphaproteobacteria bacterium]